MRAIRTRPSAAAAALFAGLLTSTALPAGAAAQSGGAGGSCAIGKAGADGQDISRELGTALERCREVAIAAGRYTLAKSLQIPSGVTLRGAVGEDGKPATRITAARSMLDDPDTVLDTMLMAGTYLSAGNPLPFRPNLSLYASVRLPVAPFPAGARSLQIDNPATLKRLQAALEGVTIEGSDPARLPGVFVFSNRYWRHGFNNFRPLHGEVNQITAVDLASGRVQLAKPLGFGIEDGILGIPDRRRGGPVPAYPSGGKVPQHIASDVTVRDLALYATGFGRGPIAFQGCYACTFTNLELSGASLIGGNALGWSEVSEISGVFTSILLDTGYITANSTFEGWRDIRYDLDVIAPELRGRRDVDGRGRVRGDHMDTPGQSNRPMIQHGESSSRNVFRNFDIDIGGRGFQDLFRVTGVQGALIEDFTVHFSGEGGAQLKRSLVNLNDHEAEDYLLTSAIDDCFAEGRVRKVALGGGTGGKRDEAGAADARAPAQTVAMTEKRKLKGPRDRRGEIVLLSWPVAERNKGFAAAVTNGAVVTDDQGCRGAVALAVELRLPAGAVPERTRDRLELEIAAQDRVNGGDRPAHVEVGGTRRQIQEVVALDRDRLLLLIEGDDRRGGAALERGAAARTDLLPGVEATIGGAVIDNDNEQPTRDIRHGEVTATTEDGTVTPSLGVVRATEEKRARREAELTATDAPLAGGGDREATREARREARREAKREARAEGADPQEAAAAAARPAAKTAPGQGMTIRIGELR